MKHLLVVLMLAACGGPPRAGDTLADTIRNYNDGVRWGRFEVAAKSIPVKQRSEFVDDNDERAKDLKITQYDIVNVDQKGSREAKVHIKMEWYSDREGLLHETHAVQTWEKQGKDWMLVDESRLKGTEMLGLQEPMAKDDADADPKAESKPAR
ncbi:MAG TPA: hypothetical protein VGC41_17030 [Kofleriaceae bacterium]